MKQSVHTRNNDECEFGRISKVVKSKEGRSQDERKDREMARRQAKRNDKRSRDYSFA